MSLIKSVSGVRGIVDGAGGREVTLTPEICALLGRAFATFLRRNRASTKEPSAVLLGGRDGRPGGEKLLAAFATGAGQSGMAVRDLGVTTTPGLGLAVSESCAAGAASGGVMITASHNPQEWNGVKLLLDTGRAPTAGDAERVFNLLDRGDFDDAPDDAPCSTDEPFDAGEMHVERVCQHVDTASVSSAGFRVLLDSVNGSGGRSGKMLLEQLGCKVVHENAEPDVGFPRQPEPTEANLRGACDAVRAANVAVGFVQDPDADRLAIIDETGRYIGEEYTLALAVKHVFATRPGPIVANLSTSRMIDALAEQFGGSCRVHRSAVGEANVVERMQEVGAHLGGEGNGGVIDPRVVLIRDSLGSMALVLQLMAAIKQPLSQIVDGIPRFTIVKHKIEVDRPRIDRVLQAIKQQFSDQQINDTDGIRIDWSHGWVHVRASNTEPIMRIIAEAADRPAAERMIEQMQSVVGGVS